MVMINSLPSNLMKNSREVDLARDFQFFCPSFVCEHFIFISQHSSNRINNVLERLNLSRIVSCVLHYICQIIYFFDFLICVDFSKIIKNFDFLIRNNLCERHKSMWGKPFFLYFECLFFQFCYFKHFCF